MNKKNINIIFIFYSFTIAPSCSRSYQSESLQEGDLLFQNLNCGSLCNAIESTTEGTDGKDFSHCAILVNINDTLKVIEALGNKVQINSLETFFARSDDPARNQNVTIARVKPQFERLIAKAIEFAKQQVGQPYDYEFLLENGKWYCSELLYQSFKEANNQKDFFELEPMTFKDQKTKEFFPAWVEYYKQLNVLIPEGKLGTNPGLISRSNKIRIVNY